MIKASSAIGLLCGQFHKLAIRVTDLEAGLNRPKLTAQDLGASDLPRFVHGGAAAGRTPEWRDLLHAQGGQRRDRTMADALYNRMRPHSSLGYRPPAPEIVI